MSPVGIVVKRKKRKEKREKNRLYLCERAPDFPGRLAVLRPPIDILELKRNETIATLCGCMHIANAISDYHFFQITQHKNIKIVIARQLLSINKCMYNLC